MKKILLLLVCAFAAIGLSAQTQYFYEDFEAGIPAGWTAEDTWMHGNATALSSASLDLSGNAGSFMAFNDDSNSQTHVGGGRVITAPIDLTAVAAPVFLELNVFFPNLDYQGLDETFKVFASVDGGATWEQLADYGALNWSAEFLSVDQFAGQMVTLAFEYLDGDQWNYGVAFDDVSISDEIIYSQARDYRMTINGGTQFNQCAANVEYPIEGLVFNSGYEPITSFDINVSDGTNTNTYTLDNMNIEKGGAAPYAIADKVNTGTSLNSYEVSISNVNGVADADEDTSDNQATLTFDPTELNPNQAVLVEEATGTWCTWCPRGTVYLDEMSKRFGHNFVGVAVHNNDPMVLAEYDSGLTSFQGFQGFPSVIYNRTNVIDPSEIIVPTINDASQEPVATLEIGAEEAGSTLSSSVKVTFHEAVTANHNVVVILTEDGLTGPAADGWNQVNASYTGGGNGPMGGFEYLPGSVPSEMWPYDHVGRALIGGYNGVNEVVGDFVDGSRPSVYMPDFDVPAEWNKDNMHVVAVLFNAAGQVVNATSGKYNDVILTGLVSGTEEVLGQDFASVYPNPADNMTTINMTLEAPSMVQVELIDNLGRMISSKKYGELSGRNQLDYDVSNVNPGIYMMNVRVDNQLVTKKITIQ